MREKWASQTSDPGAKMRMQIADADVGAVACRALRCCGAWILKILQAAQTFAHTMVFLAI